jgi:uncharacterized membrane protein YhdT
MLVKFILYSLVYLYIIYFLVMLVCFGFAYMLQHFEYIQLVAPLIFAALFTTINSFVYYHREKEDESYSKR